MARRRSHASGGIPPQPEAPLPVAQVALPLPTPLEALCKRLHIGLGDIKRFEDGGDELEVMTRQGTYHRVKRADLHLEAP